MRENIIDAICIDLEPRDSPARSAGDSWLEIAFAFIKTTPINLSCRLVLVQYRELLPSLISRALLLEPDVQSTLGEVKPACFIRHSFTSKLFRIQAKEIPRILKLGFKKSQNKLLNLRDKVVRGVSYLLLVLQLILKPTKEISLYQL